MTTLESRIQRLEDVEAVRDTWYDYLQSLDEGGGKMIVDLFTEDSIVEIVGLDAGDGVYHGRESIFDNLYGCFFKPDRPTTTTGHHGTSGLRVVVDGDEATTSAYFFEISFDDLFLSGSYRHRMRREPDRWRIAHLRIAVTFRCQISLANPRSTFLRHPGPPR